MHLAYFHRRSGQKRKAETAGDWVAAPLERVAVTSYASASLSRLVANAASHTLFRDPAVTRIVARWCHGEWAHPCGTGPSGFAEMDGPTGPTSLDQRCVGDLRLYKWRRPDHRPFGYTECEQSSHTSSRRLRRVSFPLRDRPTRTCHRSVKFGKKTPALK